MSNSELQTARRWRSAETGTGPSRDYWPEIANLKAADASNFLELGLRYMIVLIAGFSLCLATGSLLLLVWATAYVVLNALYCLYLHRITAPVSTSAYWVAFAANGFISALYTLLPLYLTTQGPLALTFIGVAGIVGLALHNISRHNELTLVAYWDAFLVAGSCLFIGTMQALAAKTGTGQLVITVGTLGTTGYFLFCFFDVLQTRKALALEQRRAAEAQKLEAIGKLTGGMAHDFNNILTVIQGNLELYKAVETETDRQRALDQAHQASLRAAGLVSQLLSFARRARLSPKPISVSEFLPAFAQTAQQVLPDNIEWVVPDTLPDCIFPVDSTQLDAAMMQLACNAADAMPDGGQITLQIEPIDLPTRSLPPALRDLDQSDLPPGRYMWLRMTDTGIGVTPEDLPQITDPFFTTKPVGHGSGLGLSMIKGFAEQSGGAAAFSSVPGQGFTASLLFPKRLT